MNGKGLQKGVGMRVTGISLGIGIVCLLLISGCAANKRSLLEYDYPAYPSGYDGFYPTPPHYIPGMYGTFPYPYYYP
jgi:hypothetical protein